MKTIFVKTNEGYKVYQESWSALGRFIHKIGWLFFHNYNRKWAFSPCGWRTGFGEQELRDIAAKLKEVNSLKDNFTENA